MTTTAVAPVARPSVGSQLVYYAGWVLMLLVESALWSVLGVVVGLVAFTVGGLAWGWWQFDQTSADERLRGPVLRLTQRLLGWGVLGFVGAVLVGGPPGVAASAASTGYRDGRRLVVESSLLYALVWATFHVARPDAGMPIGLAPAWF